MQRQIGKLLFYCCGWKQIVHRPFLHSYKNRPFVRQKQVFLRASQYYYSDGLIQQNQTQTMKMVLGAYLLQIPKILCFKLNFERIDYYSQNLIVGILKGSKVLVHILIQAFGMCLQVYNLTVYWLLINKFSFKKMFCNFAYSASGARGMVNTRASCVFACRYYNINNFNKEKYFISEWIYFIFGVAKTHFFGANLINSVLIIMK